MTDLPPRLRRRARRRAPGRRSTLVTESVSDRGDTVKFLWGLEGGARVETVLMLYPDRATVCVSSQAGCAMGCGFCATGQAGFTRHLTTGEIVEQVVRAASRRPAELGRRAEQRRVHGHGRAAGQRVCGVGRRASACTPTSGCRPATSRSRPSGIVPGIRRLAERQLPVTLAVSLHAANDDLRDELVPINRRYRLDALLAACADFVAVNRRRLSFEWALIDGVNDRPSDAVELAALSRRLRPAAHVNLIPLNPTPGWPTQGSPPARVAAFRDRLVGLGVNATVRRNRGTDIDAACGQLAAATPSSLDGDAQQPASRTHGYGLTDGPAARVDLEVQVRGAAGVAGVTDVADHLALGHAAARALERS